MQNTTQAPDVLVVGDLLMDYQYWVQSMPAPGGDVAILASAQNSGGSAANTGIALRAQNVSCGFCGRIGVDPLGDELIGQMEQIGVDLSCLHRCGGTGYTVTMIDQTGERTMFSYRGDGGTWRIGDALCAMFEKIRIFYVSGYMLLEPDQAAFAIEAAALARAAGCWVMLDTAPTIGRVTPDIRSAFLQHTDVLLPNQSELLMLAECDNPTQSIEKLLDIVPCVAVKMGGDGAQLTARPGFRLPLADRLECHVPAEKVEPVDTTGAGDSFNAGFMAAFLASDRPEDWLAAGNRLAAQTIVHRGAVSHFRA